MQKRSVGSDSRVEAKEALRELYEEVEGEIEERKKRTVGRQPGEIVDRGKPSEHKEPWNLADIEKAFPQITFTPEETIPVTFQGHTWYLQTDNTVTVPSVIKGIYDEHRRLNRRTPTVLITPGGDAVHVSPGVGALEPEKYIEV